MTRKLYYEDPYMKEFDAKVLKINREKVILDQSAFYPEGGGQVGDTGEIEGVKVMNTKKTIEKTEIVDGKEIPLGSKIIHVLEEEPNFKVGDTVHGKIDWERRHKIMRLHSAAHFTYYATLEVFGDLKIRGSKVDDKKDRLDFAFEKRLEPEKLREVEDKVNEILSKNLEIKTSSDSKESNIRYWEVKGFPRMPCGGTHPRNTSEIGKVKLKRKNPGAGLERIETYLID